MSDANNFTARPLPNITQPLSPEGPSSEPIAPFTREWCPGYATTTATDPDTHLITTETQGVGDIPDAMTIYSLYRGRAERVPNAPLYSFKENGEWVSKTGRDTLKDIRATAKGFIRLGVRKGDTVALMCHTSYEWIVLDAAVVSIGGVLATIYDTDSTEQIRHIVANSDARWLVVETLDMKRKGEDAVHGKDGFRGILCLEDGALAQIRAYGENVANAELDRRIDDVRKTDLCSIVYTSGSTGTPKGVEMTHESYCTTAVNLNAYLPSVLADPKGAVLMFLPLAHSFARAINYIVVASQIRSYISGSFKTLLSDLQYARPTTMIAVPRVYEKVYNAASQKAGHGWKGHVFAHSVKNACAYMNEIGKNGHPSFHTAVMHAAYDAAVYSQLRDVLGGRAKWLVCGGAPLDPQLLSFFRGAGIPLYEGYGMTETTAPCTFTPLGAPYHPGSVGIAFPGFAVRIAKDGEIQVKGTAVFKKYHKNPVATAEAFTNDGWCVTGDMGRIDDEGFTYVTGRKKDLIITAGGKNVSPRPMEEVIERCPIVSHAVVLGDQRPFVSALVTLDEPALRDWLAAEKLDENMSLPEACSNAAVRAEIQRFVNQANATESRAESVRKFIVVPDDFTQENGMMTASMKVIRPHVMRHYQHLLDTQMYVPRKK